MDVTVTYDGDFTLLRIIKLALTFLRNFHTWAKFHSSDMGLGGYVPTPCEPNCLVANVRLGDDNRCVIQNLWFGIFVNGRVYIIKNSC